MRVAGLNVPKEHGAWAMLYVPFVLGVLVAGRVTLATLWTLLAMTALFFARETLWRLRRARAKQRPAAALGPALGIEAAVIVFCGALLVFSHALLWFVPLGVAALLVLVFNLERTEQREERSIASQLVAIAGFAMAAPAAYYASRAAWQTTAIWLWGLSWAYFASSVFHVKSVVLGVQPQRRAAFARMRAIAAAYHAVVAVTLGLLVARATLPPLVLVAFVPILGRAVWSMLRRPVRLNLRRIGILEIFYSLNFLLFVTLAFRLR